LRHGELATHLAFSDFDPDLFYSIMAAQHVEAAMQRSGQRRYCASGSPSQ
jgi:hypothetical protein